MAFPRLMISSLPICKNHASAQWKKIFENLRRRFSKHHHNTSLVWLATVVIDGWWWVVGDGWWAFVKRAGKQDEREPYRRHQQHQMHPQTNRSTRSIVWSNSGKTTKSLSSADRRLANNRDDVRSLICDRLRRINRSRPYCTQLRNCCDCRFWSSDKPSQQATTSDCNCCGTPKCSTFNPHSKTAGSVFLGGLFEILGLFDIKLVFEASIKSVSGISTVITGHSALPPVFLEGNLLPFFQHGADFKICDVHCK